jgi:hypothetical protein
MLFTGFPGVATGLCLQLAMLGVVHWKTGKKESFQMDADGESGFEKLLLLYVDVTKFVLGLATGSIVLLVGSSAFHAGGRLPDSFASPLFLLALSVLYGILFMTLLTLDYESYRHNRLSYKRSKYVPNQAFGFGALLCFFAGYTWLVVVVTR